MPGFLIPQTSATPLTISDVFVVISEAAMLSLNAQVGDIAIRTDINKSFILSNSVPGTLSNWKELLSPPDAVTSVDGQTGSVTLNTTYQALDADLTAIAALTGTGFAKRTGNNTWELDTNTYLTTSTASSTYAPLTSPALTGTPTAPTADVNTNTTQIATTAFVNAEIANDAVVKNTTNSSNATVIQAAAAGNIPLVLRGAASQSGDLLQVQNNSNTVLSGISSDGRIGLGLAPTTGYHMDAAGKGRFLQVDAPTTGAIVIRQPSGDSTAAFIQWVNHANSAQRGWIGADANGISIAGPSGNASLTVESTGKIQVAGSIVLEAPLVQNQQTTSYTLVRADASKLIEMNSGSAITLTIPADASVAFPVGTKIDILQTGAGQVTIAGSGFTPNATPGLKINAQWGAASLIKRGTNSWVVIGNLAA
jgi:hypothetical protein